MIETETIETDDTYQGDDGVADIPTLLDADLNFAEGYQEQIGEYATGSTFKNLKDVFKTNKELHTTLTKVNMEKAELAKLVEETSEKPQVDLPKDAAEFRTQLAIPDLPDGMVLGEDVLDKAVEYAMEKGYGPKELSDFLAFDLQRAQMESERSKSEEFARIEGAKGIISEAVGEQNYDMTIANAEHVRETLGLPLESEDLIANPNMVLALAKIRKSLGEGSLKGAYVGGVEITSGSKLQQAEDIITNPDNSLHKAFHDSSDPQFEWAHQEHARLISESAR